MGNFYTPGKNGYYWTMAAYLSDNHVYVNDTRLLAYMPSFQHLYVDFYPALYNPSYPVTLYFFINDVPAGQAMITTPDGLVYMQTPLPKGKLTFKTTDTGGNLLKAEYFITKNYALFFDVAAQNMEQRAVDFIRIQNDFDFQTIRAERLYPVIGVFFDFPPPPGWTNDKYRAVLTGGCGPGMTTAFWWGGTKKAVKDVVKSITCADAVIQPIKNGDYWVLYDAASAPDVTDPGSPAWVIRSSTAVAPHKNIELFSSDYLSSAVEVIVTDSLAVVVDEQVTKQTDSFIQVEFPEPYVLDNQDLIISLEYTDDPTSIANYTTVFPVGTTTAALAAAAIIAQNPMLWTTYDAGGGILRIGVAPEVDRVQRLTVIGGAAAATLGLTVGSSVDVSSDRLNNPWVQTAVTLTFGTTTYVQGVDYIINDDSGQIIWVPSSPTIMPPPKGQVFLASYSYQMRREIEYLAGLLAPATTTLKFVYL